MPTRRSSKLVWLLLIVAFASLWPGTHGARHPLSTMPKHAPAPGVSHNGSANARDLDATLRFYVCIDMLACVLLTCLHCYVPSSIPSAAERPAAPAPAPTAAPAALAPAAGRGRG
ncbi:hypothetical protein CHLNCDRAFT_54016 [Chlorella variabilis]|uniref:Uncharacterized protein n=1 Tax=Chlorella variabilis TaxID=554065 RepID=E1ZM55_CHLVA|nr:hypothetical protein CHLNCDRAFT_54016 [Chlorella variabilis]EFN53052.1 hypothetical protein CHLNCDRAFT_54016 [Chlorella variabilis]|eukprot:XP_005845154.1 hypothetical protein CHLNCDRAFT_54016 [Chlorella variabilis]